MSEQEYKQFIYEKSSKVKNLWQLLKLLWEIRQYKHDYGTIIYGCAAAMFGALNYINRSPNGGITGFQASFVMWECVHKFRGDENHPLRLVDYNNMLYPQYEQDFSKSISADTWKYLQEKAIKNLSTLNKDLASERVVNHWKDIANGIVPFGYTVRE